VPAPAVAAPSALSETLRYGSRPRRGAVTDRRGL